MNFKQHISRAEVAAERAIEAQAMLSDCRLCAHECGVNRHSGERGKCKAGAITRIFSAQVEVSDELNIIPTYSIAFSGCDLRCDFCITGAESWNPNVGRACDAAKLAEEAIAAVRNGARSVMFLGGEPTIHLAAALEIISYLPGEIQVIWKTNGHGSKDARRLLDGMVDLWLVDFKFGNDDCAMRLSKTSNYTSILETNLSWAAEHSKLMVRHLLMPGHLECCWKPIAAWLETYSPDTEVSLRTGFWPAWKSRRHSELSNFFQTEEEQMARKIGLEHGLPLLS